MSGKPILPIVVTFEANTAQRLCGCRRCTSRPWADEHCSAVVEHRAKQKQLVWLCSCRGSLAYPYCDGTHNPRNSMSIWQAVKAITAGWFRRRSPDERRP
ncbi:CDGSH iron-sulfur domain-containing protein [Thalassolituus sp. LLYu03]|uniref:CDGSH iron-sulfur domain-containing protein n=1 Tax=Thalassolituus sp. LLYu03 TaxID=3421656 RepID=UPI003D2A2D46